MKNKIPKYIIDIYIHALKRKCPLSKMMYNGIVNKYNRSKGRASSFISYYIVSEKKNDSN